MKNNVVGFQKGHNVPKYAYQLCIDSCSELANYRIGLITTLELLTRGDGLDEDNVSREELNEVINSTCRLLYLLMVHDLDNFDLFDEKLEEME